ncbi:MAG: efflux RND transporter periplasmic adaptor subunit [Sandaracinaceae bacterium]
MRPSPGLSADFVLTRLGMVLLPWAGLALCACGPGANAYQPPPPTPVTVARPVTGTLLDVIEQDGVVTGLQQVEIRARVQGTITAIHFEDGADVETGDPLFTIDPQEYRAALDQAQAALQARQAAAALARTTFERAERLYEGESISLQELDERRQAASREVSNVAEARAAVESARINLGFTEVRSPIDGQISRRLVDIGALVGFDGPTLLARVVNRSQVYVDFSLSQDEVLDLRARVREQLPEDRDPEQPVRDIHIPVFVRLANEESFRHEGFLDSVENTLNPSTGTLEMRGVFPNTGSDLLPGLFCRVRLPVGRAEGTLVPETAIGLDQVGRYVFVVEEGEDGQPTVERRDVIVGSSQGGFQRIRQGIEADDRVVINGMARLRVGSRVEPTEETLEPPESLTDADVLDEDGGAVDDDAPDEVPESSSAVGSPPEGRASPEEG